MLKKEFIEKSMNTVSVGINIVLEQEGDYVVAHCPALGISSYGDSKRKALKRFDEEMEIFLEETSKKGTLEKYLLKLGWTS